MIVKVDTYRKPKTIRLRKPKAPKKEGANHYKVRSAALLTLGFENYKGYLKSNLWAEIKSRIMSKSNGKCACCGESAYTVHHVTYSVAVLAGKEDSQLIPVCKSCHYSIEFKGKHKLLDATSIHKKLGRVANSKSHRGKGTGKKPWRNSQPMCRCCRQKKNKPLGRDGICLDCYRRYRVNVHEVARQQDEKALRKECSTE